MAKDVKSDYIATPAVQHTTLLKITLEAVSSTFQWLMGENTPNQNVRPKRVSSKPKSKRPVVIDLTTDDEDNSNDEITHLYTIKRKPVEPKPLQKTTKKLTSTYASRYSTKETKETLCKAISKKGELHTTQVNSLISNEEISCFVIDSYLQKLCEEDPRLAYIETSRNVQADLIERLNKKPQYLSNTRKALQKADTIFVPMCTGKPGTAGNHFYLVILKKTPSNKFSLFCLDGFNSLDRVKHLKKAKAMLASYFGDPAFESRIEKSTCLDIPTQTNFVDCGAVIAYWASQLAHQLPPFSIPQGKCDYSAFRWDIAQKLLEDNNKPRKLLIT
ncbi:MAG: hypothetical protein JSR17_06735 [Proteobacteria bacterium]|nr:hypothetical protein [Pseudomonadota bacterium]